MLNVTIYVELYVKLFNIVIEVKSKLVATEVKT